MVVGGLSRARFVTDWLMAAVRSRRASQPIFRDSREAPRTTQNTMYPHGPQISKKLPAITTPAGPGGAGRVAGRGGQPGACRDCGGAWAELPAGASSRQWATVRAAQQLLVCVTERFQTRSAAASSALLRNGTHRLPESIPRTP